MPNPTAEVIEAMRADLWERLVPEFKSQAQARRVHTILDEWVWMWARTDKTERREG